MSASRARESLLEKEVIQRISLEGEEDGRETSSPWMWQQCGLEKSPAGRSREWESAEMHNRMMVIMHPRDAAVKGADKAG